jgi:hypothetical protein
MKKKLLIFFAVAVAVVFCITSITHAQTPKNGLSITPLSFEYSLSDGDTKTGTFYLSNIGDKDLNIKATTKNFIAQGEDGEVSLTGESKSYALASWMTVSPQATILPAKSYKVPFVFTITVPDKPEPGGHFGSVVFSTEPDPNLKQTGARVSQEVAGLVFVETPGNVKEKANIESFIADKSFYEFGPVNFVTRVKNDSTIHIKPGGTITIADMFGKKETITVDQKNVLPNAIRKLAATWDKHSLLGKYTATVNLRYGSKSTLLTASTTFFAFPTTYGLIGLGILIAIIAINTFVVLFFVRLGRKKKTKE